MSIDPFLLIGGIFFLLLGYLAYFDHDRLTQIYSRFGDSWRTAYDNNPDAWIARHRRYGIIYFVMGAAALVLSLQFSG